MENFFIDKEIELRIDRWMKEHEGDFIMDIARLVKHRSVSQPSDSYPFGKECAEALDEALELATKYGFEGKNFDHHCATSIMKGAGGAQRTIGAFSHLDVVPAGTGWDNEPFLLTRKDRFLIGRGVSDNKGPAVAMMYAMRFMKESGIKLKHDVVHYLGSSEETGMQDITYFKMHGEVPDFSIVPDCDFPVCFGEKGIMRPTFSHALCGDLRNFQAGTVVNAIPAMASVSFLGRTITATGKAGHAAFPQGTMNAIAVLCNKLLENEELGGEDQALVHSLLRVSGKSDGSLVGIACEDEVSGALTASATMLAQERGKVWFSMDIRYPVTMDGEIIKQTLAETMGKDGWALESITDSKPYYLPKDTPIVKTLVDIANHVTGEELEPYTMGGGTYARNLPHAIGFGPGIKHAPRLFPMGRGGAHQVDEHISLDVLEKGMKAYVFALIAIDAIIDTL